MAVRRLSDGRCGVHVMYRRAHVARRVVAPWYRTCLWAAVGAGANVSTAAQAGTAERGGSAGRAASDDGGVFGGDRACGGAMTAGAVGGSQAAGGGGAAGASVGQRLLAVADGFRSGAISEAQKRAAKVSVIAAANGEGGPSTPPRRASGGLIRLSHA